MSFTSCDAILSVMSNRYPPDYAFVVQFDAESDPAGEGLTGRVEHIESGRNCRFTSSQELDEFMMEVLRRVLDCESEGQWPPQTTS